MSGLSTTATNGVSLKTLFRIVTPSVGFNAPDAALSQGSIHTLHQKGCKTAIIFSRISVFYN